jgi:parvulin-like peptidyl-prolyl isomerase
MMYHPATQAFSFSNASRPAAAGCRGAAQRLTLWLFILLGVVLLAAALSATSIRDLIGSNAASASPPEATPIRTAAPAASADVKPAEVNVEQDSTAAAFGIDQLRAVFSVLGDKERARVLEDEAAFTDLVRKEQARWAILQAARSAGLESSPQVEYLMQRSAEQVLVDAYVKLNVGAAVPAAFPSEEQIRQFYEQNRSSYRIEARIPVWQIFLPVPESAGPGQTSDIERRAKDLAASLRAGKLEFGNAAAEHSAHNASRLNGGFMGNLKVDELIPEVKSAVVEAQVGKILDPVRSPSGFHILKRGERIEAQQLELDEVRERIRTTLRQAAETRARQVLVSRARENAGGDPGDEQLKSWRAALSNKTAGSP